MSHIFVSYAREDSTFVLELVNRLKNLGLNIWIDQSNIQAGEDWDKQVQQALEVSTCVLVFLSPHSCDSNNVNDEIAFALDNSKKIIPYEYIKCEVPFRLIRKQRIMHFLDSDKAYEQLLFAFGLVPQEDNLIDIWVESQLSEYKSELESMTFSNFLQVGSETSWKWMLIGMVLKYDPIVPTIIMVLFSVVIPNLFLSMLYGSTEFFTDKFFLIFLFIATLFFYLWAYIGRRYMWSTFRKGIRHDILDRTLTVSK